MWSAKHPDLSNRAATLADKPHLRQSGLPCSDMADLFSAAVDFIGYVVKQVRAFLPARMAVALECLSGGNAGPVNQFGSADEKLVSRSAGGFRLEGRVAGCPFSRDEVSAMWSEV